MAAAGSDARMTVVHALMEAGHKFREHLPPEFP